MELTITQDNFSDIGMADPKSKGRKKGVPNYNIEILLNVIESILPTAQFDWIKVAAAYMKASREGHLRDGADIRRFFNKVHNAVKKPHQVHFSSTVLEKARCIGIGMQAKAEGTADTTRTHRHAELTYEILMKEADEIDCQSVHSDEESTGQQGQGSGIYPDGRKRRLSDNDLNIYRQKPPSNIEVHHNQFNQVQDGNMAEWVKFQSHMEAFHAQYEIVRTSCERMLATFDRAATFSSFNMPHSNCVSGFPSMPSNALMPAPLPPSPRVSVEIGCFVRHPVDGNKFLVGKRKGQEKLALPGGHLEASTLILCVWLLMWLQVGESWEECAAREVFAATNLLIEDVSFAAVVNSPHVDGDPYKHCVTIFLTGRTSSSSTSSLSLSSSGDNNSLSSVSSSATKSSKRDTFPINTEGRGMWQWMTWTEALPLRHFTPPILFEPLINLIENCQERPF